MYRLIERLVPEERPALVRGDSAFGNQGVMAEMERTEQHYTSSSYGKLPGLGWLYHARPGTLQPLSAGSRAHLQLVELVCHTGTPEDTPGGNH